MSCQERGEPAIAFVRSGARVVRSSALLRRWPRGTIRAGGVALAGAALGTALLARLSFAQDPGAAPETVLREIRVSTRDVFEPEEARHNLIYALANFLHAVTHEVVIRREAWFAPGDPITDADVAEYERNLRAMGLFGEVRAQRIDNGDGTSDVDVQTRDRFSLLFSAGVSFVGGVDSYNASVGERNLFGTAKQIYLTGRQEGDDHSYNLRYVDPQLLGSWHRLTIDLGGTDEGDAFGFDLRRPFKHLTDPWSYGVSAASASDDVDYYERGEVVASVPRTSDRFGVFGLRAYGPRQRRSHIGLDVRGEQASFEPTQGEQPDFVTAPADYDELQVGLLWGVDWEDDYRVLHGLDALDYDEDLTLGVFAALRTALAVRDSEETGTAHQPLFELDLRAAAEPARETYLTGQLDGALRWQDAQVLAYRTRAAAHAYQMSLPSQTLAASLLWDAAEDEQGLPPQLTLGEDNGLRGYPARQFAGSPQMLFNLEDRFDTGLELWSVHLGLVGFFDMGWVDDTSQDLSFGEPLRSAGFGLRFGSTELFGGKVFRLDFAWPLDEVAGESFGLSVSASVGQVFSVFGNQTSLGSEFRGFFD